MDVQGEPSFRQSVDIMFNRAAALMDLSPGLEEKIRVCNATYTVRFGVRLRGKIGSLQGVARVGGQVVCEGRMTFALGDPATSAVRG